MKVALPDNPKDIESQSTKRIENVMRTENTVVLARSGGNDGFGKSHLLKLVEYHDSKGEGMVRVRMKGEMIEKGRYFMTLIALNDIKLKLRDLEL
jgi:ABC-type nitrate/sulfonate/bicarbonate transport system ATPase subunit